MNNTIEVEWKAKIVSDDFVFPDTVRLLLYRPAGTGLYETVSAGPLIITTKHEGESSRDSGIPMAAGVLRAIREAIDDWQGIPKSNAEAENKVLREVLAKEQQRVDKVLES